MAYESKRNYDLIVRRKLPALERQVGHVVRNGAEGKCPRCGADGVYDLEGLGFAMEAGNSIHYSTVFNNWRCQVCDFRMHF